MLKKTQKKKTEAEWEYYFNKNFWIDEETGCWDWQLVSGKGGYPCMGHNNKTYNTARFYYEKYVGHIPEGKFLLRACYNKDCCNPKHMVICDRPYHKSQWACRICGTQTTFNSRGYRFCRECNKRRSRERHLRHKGRFYAQ